MKERPILFSAPMVRAIPEGRKTQTRRVVKPQAITPSLLTEGAWKDASTGKPVRCPYGQPGDRLWVREAWSETDRDDGTPVIAYRAGGCIAIGRDFPGGPDRLLHSIAWPDLPHVEKWCPSIHMPRWASRILLEIVSVRAEPLQDISEADCWAEGIEEVMHDFDELGQAQMAKRLGCCIDDAKPLYAQLWQSINGAGSWDANPWVWVVEFKRAEVTK